MPESDSARHADLEAQLASVAHSVHLRQPRGSPPPGGIPMLAEWVLATLERQRDEARADAAGAAALRVAFSEAASAGRKAAMSLPEQAAWTRLYEAARDTTAGLGVLAERARLKAVADAARVVSNLTNPIQSSCPAGQAYRALRDALAGLEKSS